MRLPTCRLGFDCTAPSLHVGSLMQIMTLRHIQKSGHKPVVLRGGGTTKVGDPSGKDTSRPQLTDNTIAANMAGIKKVFSQFLEFEDEFDASTNKAIMVNNDDWLKDINYITFLRDYGRHFSVNRMLGKESVKRRLDRDDPLTFLEFNYMILQAYDFVELNDRYGVRAQIGGSDQWGNITEGMELNRRAHENNDDLFGLTTPLLTTSDGKKMGKTADGAVWLNAPERDDDQFGLSPYHYWQFWRNTSDADTIKFIKLFTELDAEQIAELEKLEGQAINEAKIVLANEATALLHGKNEAEKAANAAAQTFAGAGVSADLPTVEVPAADLDAGIPAYQILQTAGLANSGGEARRLVKGGGAKVNDEKVGTAEQTIGSADLNDGSIKLSAGKKRHVLIKAI